MVESFFKPRIAYKHQLLTRSVHNGASDKIWSLKFSKNLKDQIAEVERVQPKSASKHTKSTGRRRKTLIANDLQVSRAFKMKRRKKLQKN